MPALFRVDVVLSFDEPVTVEEVRELRDAVLLPVPQLPSGAEDPAAEAVRLDEDGEGADVVVVVEADTPDEARERVEDAVRAALERSSWAEQGSARLELARASGAYDPGTGPS